MEKRLLFATCAIMTTLSLHALDNLLMTFKYGPSDLAGNFSFNKHTFGLDLTLDTANNIKPKIDLGYLMVGEKNGGVDFAMQLSANALYEGSDYYGGSVLPYLYAGVGYEYVHNERPGFESSPYLQGAVGLEFPFAGYANEDFKWITEARWMQMVGSGGGQDSEAAIFIGFRIGTGGIGVRSSAYDAASDDAYTQYAGAGTPELVEERAVFSDTDGDGVADKDDKCPHTPSGEIVDEMGCSDMQRIATGRGPGQAVAPQTAAPKVVKAKPATFTPIPSRRETMTALFESDSAKVSARGKEKIRDLVRRLNRDGYKYITVEGYTDNSGTFAQNVALSKKRAEAVKKLMIQYGIDAQKIAAVGKGALNPIASNDRPEGRALNRRIEIVIE